MHTATMIAAGLALLALMAGGAYALAGGAPAAVRMARLFTPIWLVIALINLLVGVFRAGVPLSVEIPVLVAVFGVPAAAAWLLARRLRPTA